MVSENYFKGVFIFGGIWAGLTAFSLSGGYVSNHHSNLKEIYFSNPIPYRPVSKPVDKNKNTKHLEGRFALVSDRRILDLLEELRL